MKKIALITGSCGLIGSESVRFLINKGFTVVGVDNDMRGVFFGKEGSTDSVRQDLTRLFPKKYIHKSIDIRNEIEIKKIFTSYQFDLIIHTAAQPSHDWAASAPFVDFSINTLATVRLLEEYRLSCPKAVFIFTSSSKVYGDRLNNLPFVEQVSRFDLPSQHPLYNGVNEDFSIDSSMHSIYGASKAAADIMVQEYGRYYNLNTGIFRGNCMTGSAHSGTMQHGFLSYLVRCIQYGQTYRIFGYKGKQVRDNIHAYDFVSALYEYYLHPHKGEVYNLGGGRALSVSILEAIEIIEILTQKKAVVRMEKEHRRGDHKWYISNNDKFTSHFPKWKMKYSIRTMLSEIIKNSR